MKLSSINLAKLNAKEIADYWDAGDKGFRRQYLCLADSWVRIRFLSQWDGKWIVHDSNCDEYKDLGSFDEVYEIIF